MSPASAVVLGFVSACVIAACSPSVTEAPVAGAREHASRSTAGLELAPPAAVPDAGSGAIEVAPALTPLLDAGPGSTGATDERAAAPSACNEQMPQAFLIRGTYAFDPNASWEESQRRKRLHRAAIEYRTRRYGFVEDFGDPGWNAHEPKHYTSVSKFFGIRVRMNRRVLVALGCVEEAIQKACAETPYAPHVLDGLRLRNTFHDGEVSNHTYGIAIDIDPNENSCCGCVPPMSEWPRCKEPAASPFERTRIPRCWVESFERFGFYWLGNDALEDTMHFEFLGDPEKIARPAVAP